MPTPQAYYELWAEHQGLKRAAFRLCMAMDVPPPTRAGARGAYLALGRLLCGDYEPPEQEQGLAPIPEGYVES